jgi:hypothetical protein
MNAPNRRAMLQGVLGLGLAFVFPALLPSGEKNAAWMAQSVLEAVYQTWCSTSDISPSVFLKGTGCLDLDESSLMARIRSDFMTGRIATHDGLVISQTELALWAWLGQGA